MSTIYQTASGAVGNVGNHLQYHTSRVGNQLQVTTNRMLPPQQREELLKKLQTFAKQNPKLAAFLATQAALIGLPLVLFLSFATTTLLVSLTTCLLLGLLAALAFTFFLVGFALLFVVPTIFLASCSATFIFIWGSVGYVVLRRLNEGEAPVKPGTRVGDKLQGLTGGRLGSWYSDGAGEGRDEKPVQLRQIPAEKSQVGVDGGRTHGGALLRENGQHGNGPINDGINGVNGWEEKWANGAKQELNGSATSNPFQVLQAEERLHNAGTDL